MATIKTDAGIVVAAKIKPGLFPGYLYPGIYDQHEAVAAMQRWNQWADSPQAQRGYQLSVQVMEYSRRRQPVPPEVIAELESIGPHKPPPYIEVLCDQQGPVEVINGYAIGNDGTTWQQGKAGQWTKTPIS